MFFLETEEGLMEIVPSVNKSRIYYNYISLYRPIFIRVEMSRGEMSGGIVRIPFKIVYELLKHFFVLSEKVLFQEFIKTSNDVACGYNDMRKKLPNNKSDTSKSNKCMYQSRRSFIDWILLLALTQNRKP